MNGLPFKKSNELRIKKIELIVWRALSNWYFSINNFISLDMNSFLFVLLKFTKVGGSVLKTEQQCFYFFQYSLNKTFANLCGIHNSVLQSAFCVCNELLTEVLQYRIKNKLVVQKLKLVKVLIVCYSRIYLWISFSRRNGCMTVKLQCSIKLS